TGLLVYGLSGGAGLSINSYYSLVASRAILGLAVAAIFSAVSVIIGQNYHGRNLHYMMGFRVSINDFAAVIWPVLGGWLGAFSWHAPFAIFLVGIPLGLAILKWVPVSQTQTRPAGVTKKVAFRTIVSRRPILITIYALMFMSTFVLSTVAVYLPQLLKQMGVSDTFTIGLYVSVLTLTVAVISLLYGWIKTILDYGAIAMIAVVLWALGFAIIVLAPGKATILIALVIIGVGRGLTFPMAIAWASEIGPESLRGSISGNVTTFTYLGIFLAPVLLGPVEIFISLPAIFMAINLGSIIVFTGLILAALVSRGHKTIDHG
ncbi:MAG: MFS transporter, partial [Actinomycetia bacterium]|nr:MFS transporter [Actinomycetes bacterium]